MSLIIYKNVFDILLKNIYNLVTFNAEIAQLVEQLSRNQ